MSRVSRGMAKPALSVKPKGISDWQGNIKLKREILRPPSRADALVGRTAFGHSHRPGILRENDIRDSFQIDSMNCFI